MSVRKKRLLVGVPIALVLLWLLGSFIAAYQFTHRRRDPYPEPPPVVGSARAEQLRLSTSDGQNIGGWFLGNDKRQTAILLLHGHGADRGDMEWLFAGLHQRGYNVMAITFRAHGDSSGKANDFGYGGRHDVEAAVAFLRQRLPGRRIVVLGLSAGAAAAIFSARSLEHQVDGYIFEAPYRDLKTAVWNRCESKMPWPTHYVGYAGLRLWAPLVLPEGLDAISPIRHIADIPADVPVLIIASSLDRDARLWEARELYAKVQSHARLVEFASPGHGHMQDDFAREYMQTVLGFVERVER